MSDLKPWMASLPVKYLEKPISSLLQPGCAREKRKLPRIVGVGGAPELTWEMLDAPAAHEDHNLARRDLLAGHGGRQARGDLEGLSGQGGEAAHGRGDPG